MTAKRIIKSALTTISGISAAAGIIYIFGTVGAAELAPEITMSWILNRLLRAACFFIPAIIYSLVSNGDDPDDDWEDNV